MNPAGLHKKLRFQAGQRAALITPPDSYQELIGSPDGVRFTDDRETSVDFLHIFARQLTELDALIPPALQWLRYDGILWISYPKGTSKVITDINRDILWQAMNKHGIRPVTQVSIDEVWSAVRFRPAEAVGK